MLGGPAAYPKLEICSDPFRMAVPTGAFNEERTAHVHVLW